MAETPAPEAQTDPAPADAVEPPAPTDTPDAGETPPWGDDFDPARAWKTIQSLREVEKEYRKAKAAAEAEAKAKADAEKSETERLQERLRAAEEALKARDHEALVARIAKDHDLPADLAEFLTATDEDGLKAQAERLAARLKAPAEDLPRKPKPRLTPGSGAVDTAPEFDPVALAAEVRKNPF